ncbi:hypothetical protein BHE74_00017289 [Ensete ventricosum]|nr:hypothetical protein BHE74_00017289 [Ensete ventricosum]
MIGAAGELDCSSNYIRLREPVKLEDKAKEEEGKKKEVPRAVLARTPSLPVGRPRAVAALARGRFFFCAGRKIEATLSEAFGPCLASPRSRRRGIASFSLWKTRRCLVPMRGDARYAPVAGGPRTGILSDLYSLDLQFIQLYLVLWLGFLLAVYSLRFSSKPFFGDWVLPSGSFLLISLPEQAKRWNLSFSLIWNTVIWLMLLNFFAKIVAATAQRYLKKQQDLELTRVKQMTIT